MYVKEYKKVLEVTYLNMQIKRCERCGVTNATTVLHIHHTVGRLGKNKNNPENLIILCQSCHIEWHEHRDHNYEIWMYKYMKQKHGDKFPIYVNGRQHKTKWIMFAEEQT